MDPYEVIPKLGFDGFRNGGKSVAPHHFLEGPDHLPLAEPTEVTALLTGGACALFPGHLLEIFQLPNFGSHLHGFGF